MQKFNKLDGIKSLIVGMSLNGGGVAYILILSLIAAILESTVIGAIYLMLSGQETADLLIFEYLGFQIHGRSLYMFVLFAVLVNMTVQIYFTRLTLSFSQKSELSIINLIVEKLFSSKTTKELLRMAEEAQSTINKTADILVANVIFPSIMIVKYFFQIIILLITVVLIAGTYATLAKAP